MLGVRSTYPVQMLRRTVGLIAGAALFVGACGQGSDSSEQAGEPAAAAGTSTTAEPSTTEPTTTEPAITELVTTAPTTTVAPDTTTSVSDTVRDFSAIAPVLDDFVSEHGLNGAGLVLVDRDDGIVFQQYVGEFSADRVSLVASSSKMITAGVLLRLADDGLLDLDAPVADAVDWGTGNPDITPAQLLSNSSGLVGLLPDPTYAPYLCQFMPDREIEECAAEVFQTPDDDGDVVPPDTEFRYGGAQWQVAGALAEAVSGKPWSQLIDEIYVEPCGVTSLGYANHWIDANGFDYPAGLDVAGLTPTENPHMEGGAYITAPDYAELLLMHLRGGMCGGGQVLSPEAVARAHADRVGEVYGDAGEPDMGYGMGWWVDRSTGIIEDGGAYGAVPWLDVEDGYGAYLVLEADAGVGQELFQLLEPVVDTAMAGG